MANGATTRLTKWVLAAVGLALLAILLGVVVRSLVSWKAILLLCVVLLPAAFLSYRLSRAERAYDRGRYGVGRRVVTGRITLDDEGCGVCGTRDENGVRRRFVKELVVDGVPIALVESGHNDYCQACFEAESEEDDRRSGTEREETERPTSGRRERNE
ncbi:hypothetical protein [Haladaptatus sp. CMAA 1911]|uniref:hypothetical protein n=1 Tax=unclassified Haladaptatus TaxID=2622732 RepID=UPI003753FB5A